MSDPTNTRGTPGPDEQADVASGGAPEEPDQQPDQQQNEQRTQRDVLDEETTDENGRPLENPSGG
ncbi:hypothetical protein L2X99_11875 [Microbacterium sp. KUDC0406]|uniref:hypothetical protein n=1 Tax=Microbacterium sp. KUDC0406 TaxID=2909588 RepID=UPI001F47B519|nr:hypothetical protein [Microbacterium sp. KUDC0406]UJP09142.1 hypothetical protein L2X99_11875 [Microbacterium sp. KUDC0406]